MVATSIAAVGGRPHIYFANFAGLRGKVNPCRHRKLEYASIAKAVKGKAFFLTFLAMCRKSAAFRSLMAAPLIPSPQLPRGSFLVRGESRSKQKSKLFAVPGISSMGSSEILRSDISPLRKLKAVTATGLWVALIIIVFAPWSLAAAADGPIGKPQIQGGNVRIEFDNHLRSRVVARFDKKDTVMGPFTASETVTIADKPWTAFLLTSQKHEHTKDTFGEGERLTVEGKAGDVKKTVSVTIYNEFPAMAFFDVQYTNSGTSKRAIKSWTNNAYTVNAQPNGGAPAFWSYQSGSYEKRPNWILPLHTNFQQENYQGMNADDYGGGTPIVDVWRRDVGIAVGHVEPRPKLVSLPVSMPDASHATIAIRLTKDVSLSPGETFHTFRTFVAVHQGDYFRALAEYRRFMMKQGFQMATAPDDAFVAVGSESYTCCG